MKKRDITEQNRKTAAATEFQQCSEMSTNNSTGLAFRVSKNPDWIRVAPCLYRNENNGRYKAIYKRGGKNIHRSLKTTNRSVADNRLREMMGKLSRIKAGGGKVLFGDLAERYIAEVLQSRGLKPKSLLDRRVNLKSLYREWPQLETLKLGAIKRADCEVWAAKRAKQISAQRFNNELGTLKQILGYAIREGCNADNPANGLRRLRITHKIPDIPSRDDVRRIVEWLRAGKRTQDAADMVELLAASGMRQDEAASLMWADVGADHVAIRGGEDGTKSGHQRTVPLFPALRDVLARIEARTGKRGRVLKIRGCKDAIAAACVALKLPHMGHHALRHCFASNAVEVGVDWKTLGTWLGHSDGGFLASKTYSHLRPEHAAQMAARMT